MPEGAKDMSAAQVVVPPTSDDELAVGLVASGNSDSWDIEIDQTLKGPEHWFVQIEGPSVYLYFEISNPAVIKSAFDFVDRHWEARRKPATARSKKSDSRDMEVALGRLATLPVILIWDDEDKDRCFFSIGESAESKIRIAICGKELKGFRIALKHVQEELTDKDADSAS